MKNKFLIIFSVILATLGILGARLVAYYGNPILLYIFIPLVSLMPVIVALYERGVENHALLGSTLLTVIALLYHVALSFIYLSGADIFVEYYFASKTYNQGAWNPLVSESYNTALSITILPAMISILSGIDLITLFKVLYPLIFSFVPIILFKAYMRIMDPKEAFLSVFYFISIFPFFTELLQIGKQMIAEVLLALMIYFVLANEKVNQNNVPALILLSLALVYSHYSTYFFWLLLFLIAIFLTFISSKHYRSFVLAVISSFVFSYLWYVYIAGGSVFHAITLIVAEFMHSLNWLFNPSYAQGVEYVVKEKSIMRQITTYLYLFSMFFIAISIISILYHIIIGKFQKRRNFHLTYYQALSVGAFVIFGISSISNLSSALNITRFYQLSLFVLAPHFIEGLKIFRKITLKDYLKSEYLSKLAALFLMIFLLFNTGFMYEVSKFIGLKEESFSGALNPSMDSSTPSHSDLVAINWIKENIPLSNFVVSSDLFGRTFLRAYLPESIIINLNKICQLKPSLLFVRKLSCKHGLLDLWYVHLVQLRGYIPVEQFVSSKCLHKIFDSGSLIYFCSK
ncbi:MAG: DUF2206 domain-containing protein [Desulfurococcaceae archaeon]